MLRKLMKHEFRATGRIMLPLFLVVLATALGANLATRQLMEMDNRFLNLLGGLLVTAFALAIAGACLVSFVLMIRRFYKNLLQDEGYVMLTLPVPVRKQIWSKLLVSMVWYAATVAVVILAFCVLFFDVAFIRNFFWIWSSFWEEVHIQCSSALFGLELLVMMFFICAGACLQIYAALAIGHSFSRHKTLWSVAVYFVGQFVLQLLGGGFIMLIDATGLDYALTQALAGLPEEVGLHVGMCMFIVLSALFAAFFQELTAFFLQERLNLE